MSSQKDHWTGWRCTAFVASSGSRIELKPGPFASEVARPNQYTTNASPSSKKFSLTLKKSKTSNFQNLCRARVSSGINSYALVFHHLHREWIPEGKTNTITAETAVHGSIYIWTCKLQSSKAWIIYRMVLLSMKSQTVWRNQQLCPGLPSSASWMNPEGQD